MTLAEKIKNMSVDEMADFLDEITRNCMSSEAECKSCPLRSSSWICDRQTIIEKLKEDVT